MYGTSGKSDVVIASFIVPDFTINLVSSGAFTLVLIPYIKQAKDKINSTRNLLFVFCIIGFLIVLILLLCSSTITKYFFPDNTNNYRKHFETLYHFTVWSIPFSFMSSILVGYLQLKEKFFLSQISAIIINIGIIIGLYFSYINNFNLIYLGVILIVCFIVRFFLQCKFSNLKFKNFNIYRDIPNLFFLKNYLISALTFSIILAIPFIVKSKGILMGEGYMSILNYSYRLIDFILVFTTSLTVILYPKISELNVSRDILTKSFHLVCNLSLVVTSIVLLFVFCSKSLLNSIYISGLNINLIISVFTLLLPIILLSTTSILLFQILFLKNKQLFTVFVTISTFIVFLLLLNMIVINLTSLIYSHIFYLLILNIILLCKLLNNNFINLTHSHIYEYSMSAFYLVSLHFLNTYVESLFYTVILGFIYFIYPVFKFINIYKNNSD